MYLVFHLVRRHPLSIHRGGNWANKFGASFPFITVLLSHIVLSNRRLNFKCQIPKYSPLASSGKRQYRRHEGEPSLK